MRAGRSTAICLVRGQKGPMRVSMHKDRHYSAAPQIDDIRAAVPEKALAQLFEKELPRLCEIQAGEPSGKALPWNVSAGPRSGQRCDHHSAR